MRISRFDPRALLFLLLLSTLTGFSQFPQIQWYYDVNDMSFGNSAMGDIDEDGKPEIVFSCYRNDSTVYALNAEDGSLLWKYNTGGCNDVAPLIYDVDMDNHLEVILPSSCNPTTFCFNGADGTVEWTAATHGSDSPPTVADVDNDGKPEILHGEFGGYVICLNGEDGSEQWQFSVDPNSWIQTAPAILDVDGNNQLDFVVANWNFDTAHRVFAFRGDNHNLIWETTLPDDVMYHGVSFADIDNDGKYELAIGSYDGYLYVLNAEDGSLHWSFAFENPNYVGAPTCIADLDNDGYYEILFFDGRKLGVVSNTGSLQWDYDIPGYAYAFRGAAIADIDGDDTLDIAFGTSSGFVKVLHGASGAEMWSIDLGLHFGNDFDIDHGPLIGDFDDDDTLDLFVVGGHAEYPDIENNYGRAYALKAGPGSGPDWPMFRRDERRSGAIPITTVGIQEESPEPPSFFVFPNPADDVITVVSDFDTGDDFKINLYDMQGKLVRILLHGKTSAGIQKLEFDIGDLKAGVYVIQFQVKESSHNQLVIKK